MAAKVNKSAEVRKLLATMDSPTEIARTLKRRGIQVSPGYVSSLKSRLSRQDPAHRPPGRPARPLPASPEALELAFDLVLAVGVKRARQLVHVAGRLIEKVQDRK